jgi:protein-tyrosine phosphatase
MTDLLKIHQITQNIFLSGIFPLNNSSIINKLGIKYILSCMNPENTYNVHNKLLINNPNITILYLPYEDYIYQNLWTKNNNKVQIYKYCNSIEDYENVLEKLRIYQNKPLIEIGYNFIDEAVKNNDNILVHCYAGMSRSVSVIIYYLMKKNGISFSNAHNFIKGIRKLIRPNDSFQKQLSDYHYYKDNYSEIHSQQIIDSLI